MYISIVINWALCYIVGSFLQIEDDRLTLYVHTYTQQVWLLQ